jgi:hypothetical protein
VKENGFAFGSEASRAPACTIGGLGAGRGLGAGQCGRRRHGQGRGHWSLSARYGRAAGAAVTPLVGFHRPKRQQQPVSTNAASIARSGSEVRARLNGEAGSATSWRAELHRMLWSHSGLLIADGRNQVGCEDRGAEECRIIR